MCFEPLPAARAKLRAVLARQNATVYDFALGAVRADMTLHVAGKDDSSSLLPIGQRQREAFPGTGEVGTIEVHVDVLEAYLPLDVVRPCLLKIDVQGGELDVLRGAGESLSQVDEILVEASFVELYEGQPLTTELICYLRDRGFRLADVHGLVRGKGGNALQGDFLFCRDHKVAAD